MKYFEFNNHAYYGLIGAPDVESAKSCFYEHICDPEEDDGEPDQISREEAKEKRDLACHRHQELSNFDEDEKAAIERNEAWLVLIDGALL